YISSCSGNTRCCGPNGHIHTLPALAYQYIQALFRWLEFRLFVAAQGGVLLKSTDAAEPTNAIGWLQRWQQQALMTKQPLPGYGLILAVVALLGMGSMAGVLNYTQSHPINIWFPLALFAVIPLLTTLFTLYFSVRPAALIKGHPVLNHLVQQFRLSAYLPYQALLMRWLYWQTQTLALTFIVAALVTFFALALFQDYQFGWSSTLIRDDATMLNLVSLITWPWHWWFEVPGTQMISQSRFSTSGFATSNEVDGWWQTLVLSILTYGLLPRLLLMWLLQWRYVRALKRSIMLSGDVEQFMVAQQHTESRNALIDNIGDFELAHVHLEQLGIPLIGWHVSTERFNLIKNLGVDPWHQDEQWLCSDAAQQLSRIALLVNGMTTPTAELADGLMLLNKQVTLVLWFDGVSEARQQTQCKSWQYFARQHQLDLRIGE
ncbi:MAG: DUF2868 domain-containing protein, partial [Reinekea sp.]